MPISSESRGQIAVFRLSGDIDKSMASEFDELLATAIDDGALDLVLDFSAVTHISSDGLKVILGEFKRIRELGGRMVQAAASDDVRALLDVAGFLPLLGEYESAEAAVAVLRAARSASA